MTTITEFLLARIAEDEAVALAASHQKLAGPFHGNWRHDSLHLSGMERDDAKHIARHDPARVLAECAAKRAILNLCDGDDMHGPRENCDDCTTIYILATVYADHPDYLPEWAV